jgi:hypothetical protein
MVWLLNEVYDLVFLVWTCVAGENLHDRLVLPQSYPESIDARILSEFSQGCPFVNDSHVVRGIPALALDEPDERPLPREPLEFDSDEICEAAGLGGSLHIVDSFEAVLD